MGAQKAPKWSPRGGQEGAKKEKKNEVKKVKLREVKKNEAFAPLDGSRPKVEGRGYKEAQEGVERAQEASQEGASDRMVVACQLLLTSC